MQNLESGGIGHHGRCLRIDEATQNCRGLVLETGIDSDAYLQSVAWATHSLPIPPALQRNFTLLTA
jgi:hypothetical protein